MCFVHGSVPFGSGKSGAAHRFKIVPEGDCKTTQNGARVASVDLNGALDKTVAGIVAGIGLEHAGWPVAFANDIDRDQRQM